MNWKLFDRCKCCWIYYSTLISWNAGPPVPIVQGDMSSSLTSFSIYWSSYFHCSAVLRPLPFWSMVLSPQPLPVHRDGLMLHSCERFEWDGCWLIWTPSRKMTQNWRVGETKVEWDIALVSNKTGCYQMKRELRRSNKKGTPTWLQFVRSKCIWTSVSTEKLLSTSDSRWSSWALRKDSDSGTGPCFTQCRNENSFQEHKRRYD